MGKIIHQWKLIYCNIDYLNDHKSVIDLSNLIRVKHLYTSCICQSDCSVIIEFYILEMINFFCFKNPKLYFTHTPAWPWWNLSDILLFSYYTNQHFIFWLYFLNHYPIDNFNQIQIGNAKLNKILVFRKIKFLRDKYLLHSNISQHSISYIIRNVEKYSDTSGFREPSPSWHAYCTWTALARHKISEVKSVWILRGRTVWK